MKEQIKRSSTERIISFITFNTFNVLINILFPEITDWELFSYHLFSCLTSYFICFLLFLLFSIFFPFIVEHTFIRIFILLLCLELSFFFISGESLVYSILFAWNDKNYIMFFYPVCIIATRVITMNINIKTIPKEQ